MSQTNYFTRYKQLLHLALPVSISQLGHISVGVVDTLMAGQLGAIPLAAATFALSVHIPFMMLALGFSYGITPLVAKAAGEGDTFEIASVLKNSVLVNVLLGLVLCLLLICSSGFLYSMQQPREILGLALPFFRIIAISLIPLQFFQAYKQFAEGLSLTKQAMYISISANVLNIFLNYVLIFGKFGVPAYGLIGSAYATLASRTIMALAMWAYVNYHQAFDIYRRKLRIVPYSFAAVRTLTAISLPIGLQLILETGAFGFAALMAGWLGTREIAAHQIALNLAAISYMVATGISAAATVRIGNDYGSGDLKELRRDGMSAYFLIIVFEFFCTGLFILFRHRLPGFYIEEQNIIKTASSLLLIAAFFQLSDGLQVVGLGILRGMGDVKIPTGIAIISYWLIGLPAGYVLAFHMHQGIEGIWYGLLMGLCVAAVLMFHRFLRKVSLLKSEMSKAA